MRPSHILFTVDGIPKITDFGLAKRLESDSRQTESGQIMGSPSYMAPEQASGHTKDVGPAADVYALGAILYEMLTGHPPFKGETPIETVRMVIDTDPVAPSRLVPRVERDLETICLKCLAKEPYKRYSTATALAADLQRYLNGEPIEARRTPLHERAIKWSKRHPVRASLAGSAAALVVGGLGFLAYDRAQNAHLAVLAKREVARVSALTAETNGLIFRAQEYINADRLNDAQRKLGEVRSKLKDEPKLRFLQDEAERLLAQIQNRVDAIDAAARNRARFREFLRNWNDTLFEETGGLELVDQRKATERSARAALSVFANADSRGLWELGPLPPALAAPEQEAVREGTYELLLVLSDVADSPADAGLALAAAKRLRPPTPAFPMRRAAWLRRTGEAKKCRG